MRWLKHLATMPASVAPAEAESRPSARFAVETTIEVRGRAYVLARLLEPGANFRLEEGSTLDGCAVEPWLDMPRALDAKGRQRYDLFTFCLKAAGDRARFVAGREVSLAGPADPPPKGAG